MLLHGTGSAGTAASAAIFSHDPLQRTCRDCTPGYCL